MFSLFAALGSVMSVALFLFFFFFQAEDGIRDTSVTGVQTCALPILIPILVAILGLVNILSYFTNGKIKIGRRRVGKECRSRWSPYH